MFMETVWNMCYENYKALYFRQFFPFAAPAVSASLVRRVFEEISSGGKEDEYIRV